MGYPGTDSATRNAASIAGHSLSISRPLRSRQVSEAKFALEGTPTDCVLFAVKHLLKAHKPDIVLSGVNRGTNIADDVTVQRQVLAEPSVELGDHTWARLTDGTPLVTGMSKGRGSIVLFHVAASPGWSTLPISGLYVDMLRRVVELSEGMRGGAAAPRPAGGVSHCATVSPCRDGWLPSAAFQSPKWSRRVCVPASVSTLRVVSSCQVMWRRPGMRMMAAAP